MKTKRKLPWGPLIGVLILIVFFVYWWGVPTYQQWQADRLVDKLCAKDGGVKVYEKVTLPESMFNKYGNPDIPFIGQAKPDRIKKIGLYLKLESKDIVGNHNSSAINRLAVWRSVTYLYRYEDGKLLGEAISYARSGGDPVGPWHPSSYGCPKNKVGSGIEREIVKMRNDNKE